MLQDNIDRYSSMSVPMLEVRDFLASALNERMADDDAGLAVDADLFELGYLNSLLALELVTYLERRFDLLIEVDDLDPENFRTILRIAEFVRRKCDSAALPAIPDGQRADN